MGENQVGCSGIIDIPKLQVNDLRKGGEGSGVWGERLIRVIRIMGF